MDITGFAQLIMTIMNGIANIDLRLINFDALGKLLDLAAPVWNPIWAYVVEFLQSIFYAA